MVVFSIAGTMWILEGLGDVEGYADQYMIAGMGEISFFQMVYFTFMTISTVGERERVCVCVRENQYIYI